MRDRKLITVWLLPLMLVLSSCTISLFEEENHSHEDEGQAHAHGEEAEGDVPVDHHGNPVYDEDERVYEKVELDGLSVEFTVENFIGAGGRGGEVAPRLVEGEHANLQFHVTDSESGDAVAGLRPAVWVDAVNGSTRACEDRIEGYLSGKLDSRPLIDLNSYFILSMNRDSTISVIDPVVDVAGMTNLFSVIILQGVPEDWVMADALGRLFVTLPDLDSVAVVDMGAFLVEETLRLPASPTGIALGHEGDRVWVGLAGPQGGVAAIDVESLEMELVPTGGKAGPIASTMDGLVLVGTSDGIEIVDDATLTNVSRAALPAAPTAIAPAGNEALVALPEAEALAVVDLSSGAVVALLSVDRGVTDLAVSPDGQWAVAVSPQADKAYVIEIAGPRVTQAIPVPGSPDQVVFTAGTAYLHNSDAAAITAIPLDRIDPEGGVEVLTIPVGEIPPAEAGIPATAPAITVTPDGTALLLPNPADDVIHLYVEGSQTPLGGFQGHTLQPRAVATVDRTMKEPSPGVYTGSLRIPDGGDYVVAFLLGDPFVAHCFTFSARSGDGSLGDSGGMFVELDLVPGDKGVAGEEHQVTVSLVERPSGVAVSGVADVGARIVAAGSGWSTSVAGVPGDDGTYTFAFTPPDPGFYNFVVAVPSLGVGVGSLPVLSVEVGGS